ncbi:YHYH protein [Luteolibacter arcticus]|uniref:YHYH protein n=1 Tax=Luteolibacter arcticus TaxID=1581411 RepID=A0ABT3GCM3_9BACT|nr:YHYH protein [Luteolibacter arcticus]MCW1921385.1 YHYH protein [Luteolibacter arcticus]
MKHPILLLTALLLANANADSKLSSWYTANAGKYARIQETDAEAVAGTSKTTWTRTTGMFTLAQTTPAYAGPTQIDYSTNWVYVRTPSLGTYTMGPWYNNAAKTQLFINVPKNQGLIIRIPRTATTIPTTKTQINGLNIGGVMQPAAGYYVDGVSLYDPTDGFSYSGGSETSPGTGQWHRDAYVNESITFDYSMAHQQNTGFYHNHANPLALRYQLGDAVSFNSTTKKYAETMSPTAHSPIVAWMIDGLPVYGPYGYASAMNANSGVRRMVGGFVKRDGNTTGVDNITTAGRTLPAWMLRNNGNTSATGPTVSTTYPLGRYIQDWAYLGDLQKSAGANYQQGVDFDLNEYNVRYCVTPEFPSGTWAYFVNISSTGTPQFPYMCNRWFYGTPTGGKVNSITETVTNHFLGGPNRPLAIPETPVVAGGNVTLTWNAVEGGTYSVDASTTGTTWTNKATGLTVSNANTKSNTHTALGTTGTEHARVQRTALATYDTTGVVTPTVSQTATTNFLLGTPPTAPTLTAISTLNGATEDTAFTISHADLAAAADEADANGDAISFRIESVVSGSLTKNGAAVIAGSTLIAAGESVVWTPGANENGTLAAFTVKAWDGALASSSAITVTASVAAVVDPNNAPVMNPVTISRDLGIGSTDSLAHSFFVSQTNPSDSDGDPIQFRIESVPNGSLTKNGVPVTPGVTTLASGEALIWSPAGLAPDTSRVGFTLKAWDGADASVNTATVQFSVKQTFDHWAEDFDLTGDDALPGADPDHDGIPNALEFSFGSSPAVVSGNPVSSTVAEGYLTLVFPRADGSEWDVDIAVETSTDLDEWDIYWLHESPEDGLIYSFGENGEAADTITIKIPVGTNPIRFARVRADED